ncbi:MAG: alpha-L-arabinofuranosidase C-terminal domain-containing protein [Bacteroidota bacterium]|nr:alpha-L-arabinofuranosidase C-terminal domain-containing protein [Bacteroidota bacterium]
MKKINILLVALWLLSVAISAQEKHVSLTLYPEKTIGQIDERIYGQYLEHIYHSSNGGLWGDMIWNRSFEETLSNDNWVIKDGYIESAPVNRETRMIIGDGSWRDYEFSLEARKTAGKDGFLVGVRSSNGPNFGPRVERDGYTLVMGAGGNHRYDLECTFFNRQLQKQEAQTVKTVSGNIETGCWYKIKVRCQGKHIQAWLNDSLTIDFTNTTGPLGGWVSMGARNARAQFRNLKVTSLTGKTLFNALPSPARHWVINGYGQVSSDNAQPFNSNRSLKIVNKTQETSISQNNLCIRRNDVCNGSFRARGDAPNGIIVRLLDGHKVLEEKKLAPPKDEWTEYPLQFNPASNLANATLQIAVKGKATVWLDQVSLMPQSAEANGGFRPDLLKAISNLQPKIIRWPGGAFLSDYNWKNAIGPQTKRISKIGWDEVDPLSLGVDEFMTLCRKVEADPVIPVNIADGSPEAIRSICEFIEYCNGPATSTWGKVREQNGHPEPYNVKYWEINDDGWRIGVDKYSEILQKLIPQMKKTDPSVKIIGCGSGGLGHEGIGLEWTRSLLAKTATIIDYISLHHFENSKRFAQGPADFEKFIRETEQLIKSSSNPDVKIFISEWNAQSTEWKTGLYCGGVLNTFERCGNIVSMASPALLMRHVLAPAWDNALINFDQEKWFGAPNYIVLKLWHDNFAPNLVELSGDSSAININTTRSADGKTIYLKAVNPSTASIAVKITIAPGFEPDKITMKEFAPGDLSARNSIDEPKKIKSQRGEVKTSGRELHFTMQPLSAGVVIIKAR